MTIVRTLLGPLVWLALAAPAVAQATVEFSLAVQCGPAEMVERGYRRLGFRPFHGAPDRDGDLWRLWLDGKGAWRVILSQPGVGAACLVAWGEDWQALDPDAGVGSF